MRAICGGGARVPQSTTVKRKVIIVKKAALDPLPAEPHDLQRWVIPQRDLDLPADIYGDDVLFIDDGYDRSKINMPGLLHLEVAVKWAREKSSGPGGDDSSGLPLSGDLGGSAGAGRPSGLSLSDDGRPSGLNLSLTDNVGGDEESAEQPPATAVAATAAPAAQQSEPSSTAATAVAATAAPAAQPVHAAEEVSAAQNARPAESEGAEPEKAMADIISQTVKAVGLGRWVSNDVSLPNTVEFWVRLFTNDMTKKPRAEAKLTEPQKAYVKFITKSFFESECGYSNLRFVVPHIVKMQQWSSDLVPPLATVLVKLNEVSFEKPETEADFHTWLQKDFSLSHMQTVYNSVMYAGFLKRRVAAQLTKAQEDETARPTLLPLLQEVIDSVEMAAELKIVATLDDTALKLKQKVLDVKYHMFFCESARTANRKNKKSLIDHLFQTSFQTTIVDHL